MKKNLLKVLLILVIIIVLIYLVFFIRNLLIINDLTNKGKGLEEKDNFSYETTTKEYASEETGESTAIYYRKGNLCKTEITSKINSEEFKTIIWGNMETNEGITLSSNTGEYETKTMKTQTADTLTLPEKIPNIADLEIDFNSLKERIIYSATHIIKTEKVNEKDCYIIETNKNNEETQNWIQKEDGILVKTKNEQRETNITNVEMDKLTDSEMEKPDTTGYEENE